MPSTAVKQARTPWQKGQVAKFVQANRRATSMQHLSTVICRRAPVDAAPTAEDRVRPCFFVRWWCFSDHIIKKLKKTWKKIKQWNYLAILANLEFYCDMPIAEWEFEVNIVRMKSSISPALCQRTQLVVTVWEYFLAQIRPLDTSCWASFECQKALLLNTNLFLMATSSKDTATASLFLFSKCL